jgi:hypothetical protein
VIDFVHPRLVVPAFFGRLPGLTDNGDIQRD